MLLPKPGFATQKLQEVAVMLVHRFRSIGRAFDELFGASASDIGSDDVATKLAKVLTFTHSLCAVIWPHTGAVLAKTNLLAS